MKKPEDHVDELLAAPDTLRENDGEKTKYLQRKEQERAKKERLLALKRQETPSTEDLLSDIIRVAEDEDTNPWHEFRSISRRRYELYGYYPVEFIDQEFGQFTHALEVAGLRDQPGTRLWRRNRAKSSREQHKQRYVERYVEPFVARQEEFRDLYEPYLLLSISDTHSQYLDPFVWLAFMQAVEDLRPDGVLFNGDILDGTEISSHKKIPGWTVPLQDELDFQREMVRQLREDAGFEGDLFMTGGNHGVDRLASYLTQVAPALVNLRSLRIDQLFGLEEFDVKLLQGGTIASPTGEEDMKPGFLLWDFYRIHHGTKLGQYPAAAELRAAGRSGQSGHVHRASLHYGTTERDEGMSWMSTPMGCRQEAGRCYIKGTTTGWQKGFGVAWLYPDHSVHQYPVIVSGSPERVTVEGHIYQRPDDLDDPEPYGLWIKHLSKRYRR
jgi:hypothetical protein